MTSEQQVYDFEAVFENAVKSVLAAREIHGYTSQDQIDFQKDFPRVEITFIVGQGQLQQRPEAARRESAWKGTIVLRVATLADMPMHSDLRTKVRAEMHKLPVTVNVEEILPLHKVGLIRDNGVSVSYDYEQGMFTTTMNFEIDFSIRANAWALLET